MAAASPDFKSKQAITSTETNGRQRIKLDASFPAWHRRHEPLLAAANADVAL
jgi:hypothetical protein